MTDCTSFITFPCDFCIKVIGNNVAELEHDLIKLAQQHYPEFAATSLRRKPSRHDRFVAFDLVVHALDQVTLDSLYLAITKHPDIRMVL